MNRIRQKFIDKGVVGFIAFCIMSGIYLVLITIYKIYLYLFVPINKNQILFMSIPDYSDNAYSLYMYIKDHYDNQYRYIWLISKDCPELPEGTAETYFIRFSSKKHKYLTLKAIKAILTSSYIFYTHTSPMQTLRKRKDQIVVNLWHGCGYKAEIIRKKATPAAKLFDYALVPGKIFITTKQIFWGCTKDAILPIGYPRYDQLLSKSKMAECFATDIKKGLQKLVIWMSTFRKTEENKYPEETIQYSYDLPMLHSIDDLKELDYYCGQLKIKLCIKRHIMQIDYAEEDAHLQNIVFIDNDDIEEAGIQLYELLPYTDALISDYSSVAVDYLLLDKPIGFCLDDFEQYKSTRGFVFDDPLAYMPGAHMYKFKDLITFLEDVVADRDLYANDRHELMPLMQNPCDNYCRRIWQTIQNLKQTM